MALPNRVPPPPDTNERTRQEQVSFESKRRGGLGIIGIIGTLVALGLIVWWFLAR
jgi:hypothetical protein